MSTQSQQAQMQTHAQSPRPQRVLACVLCQQRKVRCDRKFPCTNCTKARTECIPGSLVQRKRKRRFPERALLDRLRRYEDLLRKNNVEFEALHEESEKLSSGKEGHIESTRAGHELESESESDDDGGRRHEEMEDVKFDAASREDAVKAEKGHEVMNIWHAMDRAFHGSEHNSHSSQDVVNIDADPIRKVIDQTVDADDYLLFGLRKTTADLSALHPDPVQIFRLWQVYLDNVNPLLKVTHTPSLQGRIIEAIGNIKAVSPTLEALMFGIYCMAIVSLTTTECQATFGTTKDAILRSYQYGCQQALWNCGFLRSSDRDCLTALFFYLTSIRFNTTPLTLSSLVSIAVRIAQRMGCHKESVLGTHTAIEAEMRRRLWWSLALFDIRISEISSPKTYTLDRSWTCKIPHNVNESDLRMEMKSLPKIQGTTTDAIFPVVRCEIGEFIRQWAYCREYPGVASNSVSGGGQTEKALPEPPTLSQFDQMIENRYLKSCDPENPIHYMTIWSVRAYLAKCYLMELHPRQSNSSACQTQSQRDAATSFAFRTLECDTKVMTAPQTKGFRWYNRLYFPFPAYYQIAQDLQRRPLGSTASRAWDIMSENYDAWFDLQFQDASSFFGIFANIILQTWKVCEAQITAASKRKQTSSGESAASPPQPPKIVISIRLALAQATQETEISGLSLPDRTESSISNVELATPTSLSLTMPTPPSIDFSQMDSTLPFDMGGQDDFYSMNSGVYPVLNMFDQDHGSSKPQMGAFDWTQLDTWPDWGGI